MSRYRWFFLSFCLVLGVCPDGRAGPADPVRLDLFFSPGCTECERLKKEVLPELTACFPGRYTLVEHNLTQPETIPLLIAYQERCGNTGNGHVSLVVDHQVFLSGYAVMATGLLDRVAEALAAREDRNWVLPQAPAAASDAAVAARADRLTLPVVAAGGFLDGLNPCALSTLIFLLSLLAVAKTPRRTRLLAGLSFISASFLVYTGLGAGFLWLFRRSPDFSTVKRVVEIVLGVCMIPLGVWSFLDAFRFHRSQRPSDVTLQLPQKIKTFIHTWMDTRLGAGGPVIGGFAAGAGVTVLESVCTGQSYLPTLTFMLKRNPSDMTAWGWLLVYNLLFILPLTVAFVCFHRGLQVTALIDWNKRHLAAVKILLGLFFFAMAVLLLA